MGAQESRDETVPYTELGYWRWRDGLESELPPATADHARTRAAAADEWHSAFLRAQHRAMIRRTVAYCTRATLVTAALLTLCALAGVRWHEQLWIPILCAILAAATLYRYVSTLIAARAAFRLEQRTLTRQFPNPCRPAPEGDPA
ncbi:hypothetical protein [Nocardia bovistercoris]|uniref:Uncharacterized protein n=1 Tax=Nocardia bovistercoris TaxID=2785916 RepID=A0A931N277_9NOCA|nr:hypothetical protein [Nocardia bovistercoris]MBH0775746.1 hypothetical protein [Nocardia bovistercoris]